MRGNNRGSCLVHSAGVICNMHLNSNLLVSSACGPRRSVLFVICRSQLRCIFILPKHLQAGRAVACW